MTMKAAFYTLGCKVNQYETEAMKENFRSMGYEIVEDAAGYADVYVINTCTVTSLADRKSRQYIRRARKNNPSAVLAVTGCYAQMDPAGISAIEGVDIIAGTNEKDSLPLYVRDHIKTGRMQIHCHSREELHVYKETGPVMSTESRTRAYIKIQEGCDRFCSYCIVPYARGTIRSRQLEDIKKEAEKLVLSGFSEIVLTGINTALYSAGNGEPDIEPVIRMLEDMPGDFRVRLSSLEPTVINTGYVKRLFRYERLCRHMHLSVQSGSDRVLSAMNRNYTRKDFLEIVAVLREFDPLYGITTDMIAGFPGETEDDLEDSLSMIREAEFSRVHVFRYSKRSGTAAAAMSDQISPEIKAERSDRLAEAGEKAAETFFRKNTGTIQKVLPEEYDEKEGAVCGYSSNYIRNYIKCDPNEKEKLSGRFTDVKVIDACSNGVYSVQQ